MKVLNLLLITFLSFITPQEDDIFERLSAINNQGKIWYNIDGYSVSQEVLSYPFDEKGLNKVYKMLKISNTDLKTKDDKINRDNIFVTKQEKISDNNFQTENYYFIESSKKLITVISFKKNGKIDRDTEQKVTNAIIEDKIPEKNFVPSKINSINFAGREIELGNGCYWTFLNTVKCPYRGEMNWSIHKTLDDAKEVVENQLNVTKSRKGIKIVSEEIVDIDFEGVTTKAKKNVYSFKGVGAVLAGMSGAKTLTAYYIAENVRNKNISCVMSFWNDDQVNPETKLPSLLEKIIKLK